MGWLAVLVGGILAYWTFFAPDFCASDGLRCISEFAAMDNGSFALALALETVPVLVIGVAATYDSQRNWLGAHVTVWIASLFTLMVGFITAPSGGFLLALPALCGMLVSAMGLMRVESAAPQLHSAHE